MFHVVRYNQLFLGTININNFGGLTVRHSEYRRRAVINKMACFCPDDASISATESLTYNRTTSCPTGAKLFVSPKCRVARDIFRNSGYKLVRDREAADRIVIRSLPREFKKLFFDVAIEAYGNLFLYSINKDRNLCTNTSTVSEEDFQKIKEYFDGEAVFLTASPQKNLHAEFLPIDDEYEAILKGEITKSYMYEHEVRVQCPVDINIDTLDVWRCCDDYDVLAKAICNSNWQKYPALISTFLMVERPMTTYYGGNNMKLVCEQLGIDGPYIRSADAILADKIITPDDWNLLQDWAMHRLGVDENGGYISSETAQQYHVYKDLVRYKRVVAPLKINEPILYENISLMLK